MVALPLGLDWLSEKLGGRQTDVFLSRAMQPQERAQLVGFGETGICKSHREK
ncbi:hypothetical protein VTN02DRAFT_2425 [Thermoascus thermophilus]